MKSAAGGLDEPDPLTASIIIIKGSSILFGGFGLIGGQFGTELLRFFFQFLKRIIFGRLVFMANDNLIVFSLDDLLFMLLFGIHRRSVTEPLMWHKLP